MLSQCFQSRCARTQTQNGTSRPRGACARLPSPSPSPSPALASPPLWRRAPPLSGILPPSLTKSVPACAAPRRRRRRGRGVAAARPRAEGARTEVLRCLVFSEWVTAEAKGWGGFQTRKLSECFHTKVQSRRCFHLPPPPVYGTVSMGFDLPRWPLRPFGAPA